MKTKKEVLSVAFVLATLMLISVFAFAQDTSDSSEDIPAGDYAETQAADIPQEGIPPEDDTETIRESDTIQIPELDSFDPGMTPDSPFYFFETLGEKIQMAFTFDKEKKLELEAQYHTERLVEIKQMIEKEDFKAAEKAAQAANTLLENADDHVEEIETEPFLIEDLENEDTSFHKLLEVQKTFMQNDEYTEILKETLTEKVEQGLVDKETASDIIDDVQEGTARVEYKIHDKKEELIVEIAEINDLTVIETEIIIEEEEKEQGFVELYKEKVTSEEIETLEIAILQIENEAFEQIGEIEDKEEREDKLENTDLVIENAKLKLQMAEDAYESGKYSKAFGEFTAAKHLTLAADELAENPDESKAEELIQDPEEIRQEIAEENQRFIQEYEGAKDEILEKYPKREAYFEWTYERSQEVKELSEKLKQESMKYFEERGERSDESIRRDVYKLFSDEFRKAYGEEYIPPGFMIEGMQVTPGLREMHVLKAGGGFVQGFDYVDPQTGYQYKFEHNQYSFVTPIGERYNARYPEGYSPDTFRKGDEIYDYEMSTVEGTYSYSYFATGYEITRPDGTIESAAYPPGEYNIVGGGEIEHKATGFEFTNGDGRSMRYDYNPEFEHYVSSEGKVYIPPEETCYHMQEIQYDYAEGTYNHEFDDEGWYYDPGVNRWTSEEGKSYAPTRAGAPVGYEDQGTFVSDNGEKWTYNQERGEWITPEGEGYIPPPNNYYSYDPDSHMYTDIQGNMIDYYGHEGGFYDPGGREWNYDPTQGNWNAESGEMYDINTGEYQGFEEEPSYVYSYHEPGTHLDSYGRAWEPNADGSWTNAQGMTYTDEYHAPPPPPGGYYGGWGGEGYVPPAYDPAGEFGPPPVYDPAYGPAPEDPGYYGPGPEGEYYEPGGGYYEGEGGYYEGGAGEYYTGEEYQEEYYGGEDYSGDDYYGGDTGYYPEEGGYYAPEGDEYGGDYYYEGDGEFVGEPPPDDSAPPPDDGGGAPTGEVVRSISGWSISIDTTRYRRFF